MAIPESTSSKSDQFFDRALERIRKLMLAFAALGLLVCIVFFRWPVAAGFAAGAGVSYVNHRWLERAVEALGERITTGQSRERGGGIVFRAVLRYVFVAAGAYVIFNAFTCSALRLSRWGLPSDCGRCLRSCNRVVCFPAAWILISRVILAPASVNTASVLMQHHLQSYELSLHA